MIRTAVEVVADLDPDAGALGGGEVAPRLAADPPVQLVGSSAPRPSGVPCQAASPVVRSPAPATRRGVVEAAQRERGVADRGGVEQQVPRGGVGHRRVGPVAERQAQQPPAARVVDGDPGDAADRPPRGVDGDPRLRR